MSLYAKYAEWVQEKITTEQVADLFGMTVKDWKFRVTRYGKRLPVVLKTLDRISEDRITRSDAAKLLKVTSRQINQLEQTWSVSRPLKDYLITRAVTTVKWELRKKSAIEFIAGSASIEEAAEQAEVSPRQMRRWVSDLIDKHHGIVFMDLRSMPLNKRRRLADEIEEAEGLEIAKLNVLNEVAKGHRAIEEVALERVLAKRSNQRGVNVRRPTSQGPQEGKG